MAVPTTQEILDDLLVTKQKVAQGIAITYTEEGEKIILPSHSELDKSIAFYRSQLAAENGSRFSLFST